VILLYGGHWLNHYRNTGGAGPRHAALPVLFPKDVPAHPARKKLSTPASVGTGANFRGKTLPRPCRVPGCNRRAASSHAAYCASHRTANRRHGDPNQKAVTKAQLAPYLKIVKARIAKNPEHIAWVALDDRWRALVDHAEAVVAKAMSGAAGVGWHRLAAQEVAKLAKAVKPREVVEVVAAMVAMWELEPRAFRSDDAFWLQLSRRVRSLTDLHIGERWDFKRNRVRRCYREMNPKAAVQVGRWLAEALGAGGQHIAKVERAARENKAKETRELYEALRTLE
jgi:hypothetical protein